MHDIREYLNIVGNFFYEAEGVKYEFLGTLVESGDETNDVILRARIKATDIRAYDKTSLNLYGTINNQKFSLLNSHFNSYTGILEADYINAIAVLDQIVIGAYYVETMCIQGVSTNISSLNYFYMQHIPRFCERRIDDEFLANNPPLTADTKYGKVLLQPRLSGESTFHQLTLKSVPTMAYSFYEPKSLASAIRHIAALRNLFSFFADGYITFDTLVYTGDTDTIPELSCDNATVHLTHGDSIQEVNAPFLLTYNSIKNDFQTIVEKWLDFYENSIYIPTLFFEIITNRSRGVNQFLNLAQAIEIYSTYFRNDEAKAIRNADPEANKKREPILKHRLTDVFSFLQDILEINDVEREGLAQEISNSRNFYTHYNKSRDEPSYRTVSRMTVLLRFVVLALVYKHIGVNDQAILSCKRKSIYSTMDESIRIILLHECQTKDVWN